MEKEKTCKKVNLVIKKFYIALFIDYLKNIKKLDKNIISFIKNIYFDLASKNSFITYSLYNHEYKQKDDKMIYYYIYTYLNDLFWFLNDSNIEIDINDLIKNNVVFFE